MFALGALLAGLGGALQLPREPATSSSTCCTIGEAFVVVVVGGMGSIPGAYVAALLIAEIKAICIGIGTVACVRHRLLVLQADAGGRVSRDGGRAGRGGPGACSAGRRRLSRNSAPAEAPLRAPTQRLKVAGRRAAVVLLALPFVTAGSPYATVLMIDLLIAALFAASLHFIMGPAGMHSFGHAAYFGLGAYGAALLVRAVGLPMEAGAGRRAAGRGGSARCVFGWFACGLSGVYLAMLTLAFAQIVWSITFQWDDFTGGSNGLTGVWPARVAVGQARVLLRSRWCWWCCGALVRCGASLFSPFGYAMRAGRDSPLRADAIGIDVKRMQWVAFVIAALFAGPGRRAVRILQGQHLARNAGRRQVGRRAGDGAARRRADAGRAGGRRGHVHLAAGQRSRATPTTGARCWAA